MNIGFGKPLLSLCCFALLSSTANATLIGSMATANRVGPDVNTVVFSGGSPQGPKLAGAGLEFDNFYLGTLDIDISDNQILWTSIISNAFSAVPFNGFRLDFTGATITGLSFFDTISDADFGASDVIFTNNYVAVNLSQVSWNTGETITMTVTTSAAAPEPTTLAMMGLGLAGIGYRRSKRAGKGGTI